MSSYAACSKRKLIIRPSPAKDEMRSLEILERVHGNLCGPEAPPCAPVDPLCLNKKNELNF